MRRITLLAAGAAVALIGGGLAYADNVNTYVTSDTGIGGVRNAVVGVGTVIKYDVVANNMGGDNGCDAADGTHSPSGSQFPRASARPPRRWSSRPATRLSS